MQFRSTYALAPEQALDDVIHHLGMKHAADESHHQQQKWKKRKNGVGGDREGERVHLGAQQIARRGAQRTLLQGGPDLGRTTSRRDLEWSDGGHFSHILSNTYRFLNVPSGHWPCRRPGRASAGHLRFQSLTSCQVESSCYYLWLVSQNCGWRVSKVDVSVSGSLILRLSNTAPLHSSSRQPDDETRGAVSARCDVARPR